MCQELVAVAPGGFGLGGIPAGGCSLGLICGGSQAEWEEGGEAGLATHPSQRHQPVSDRLEGLLVAPLSQCQLRPSDGERPGELGVELGMVGLGGQVVRLVEPAASGIEVTTRDIKVGALPSCVDTVSP